MSPNQCFLPRSSGFPTIFLRIMDQYGLIFSTLENSVCIRYELQYNIPLNKIKPHSNALNVSLAV